MGGPKISSRAPVATPKATPAKAEKCTPEKKPAAPAPKPPKDTFEQKPAGKKIESIWKEGNVTGMDDWEKHNL